MKDTLLLSHLIVGMLIFAPDAMAYHDEEGRITRNTGYNLQAGQWQVGPAHLDFGIGAGLSIGTNPIAWVLPAPNFRVKWGLVETENFALAVSGELLYANTDYIWFLPESVEDDHVAGTVVPVVASATWQPSQSFGLSLSGQYTQFFADGSGEIDDEHFGGHADSNNLQSVITAEWRVSQSIALLLIADLLIFEHAEAQVDIDTRIDDFQTVSAEADVKNTGIESGLGVGNLMGGVAFSWSSFNLRIAAGYGNLKFPTFGLFYPEKTVVGDLELYWRF